MTGLAVGIDLGTTNSVVAIASGGRPRVLQQTDGSMLIPSVVSFDPEGRTLVGAPARARRMADPANTVSSVKRLLGRPFASEEVQHARGRFPFELRGGSDGSVLTHTRAGDRSLPELSALVLREARRVAEVALGESVGRAVVTVPANFNELQRTATKLAGQIADLDVIRILNEPTAAALAYGYGRGSRENIAVYDFGGGTFDVTLLALSGNVFEVLATAGDTFLGGDDIDAMITERLLSRLRDQHGVDGRAQVAVYERVRAAAERAKMDLSSVEAVTVTLPDVPVGSGGRTVEFTTRITREEVERMVAPLLVKTLDVCQEAMRIADLSPSSFESVILVGGSSRMPSVRKQVAKFFGREPLASVPPEQVVALGAAIFAEVLAGGARRKKSSQSMRAVVPTQRPAMETAPLPPSAQPNTSGTGAVSGSVRPGVPRKAVRTFSGLSDEVSALGPIAEERDGSRPSRGFEDDEATSIRVPTDVEPSAAPKTNKSTIPVVAPDAVVRPPAPAVSRPPVRPSRPDIEPSLPPISKRENVFDDEVTDVRMPEALRGAIRPLSGDLPAVAPPVPGTSGESSSAFPRTSPSSPRIAAREVPSSPQIAAPEPSVPGVAVRTAPSSPALPSFTPIAPPPEPSVPPVFAPRGPAPNARTMVGQAPFAPREPSVTPTTLAKIAPVPLPREASLSPTTPAKIAPAPPPREPSLPPVTLAKIAPAPPPREPSLPPVTLAKIVPVPPREASVSPSTPAKIAPVPPPRPAAPVTIGRPATPPVASAPPPPPPAPVMAATAPPPRIVPPAPPPPIFDAFLPLPPSETSGSIDLPMFETPSEPPKPVSLGPDSVMPLTTDDFAALAPPIPPLAPAAFEPFADISALTAMPEAPPPVVTARVRQSVVAVGSPVAPPPAWMPPVAAPVLPPAPAPPPPVAAPPPPDPPMDFFGAPELRPVAQPRRQSRRPAGMPVLIDVTPLSLGVETAGGQCECVIPRNTTIPIEQTRDFATAHDGQETVRLRIAQGESRHFNENQILGELELTGLPRAVRGEVIIAVTFELDVDGTLQVRAREARTGKETTAHVTLEGLPDAATAARMAERQRR